MLWSAPLGAGPSSSRGVGRQWSSGAIRPVNDIATGGMSSDWTSIRPTASDVIRQRLLGFAWGLTIAAWVDT